MHGDIGPTIFASIPLYLTMVETCIPQKNTNVIRKQRLEEREKAKKNGGGRKGFRTDPHARKDEVAVWAAADPDDWFRLYKVDSAQRTVTWLQATEKRSIHGVDIAGVESLGRLLRRALRLAAVIVLSGSLRDSC